MERKDINNTPAQSSEEILKLNEKLQKEVQSRTELLNVLNESMSALLGSDTTDFDSTLLKCMGRIGEMMDVDRVYIWENHMEGDELYTTQTHEWSGGAKAQQDTDLTVSVPFPPEWYPNLSQNLCINGIVRTFDTYSREHLQAQDILSIMVVPVFLHDDFWGFVGFDDCHSERLFTEMEESILRTISLLFANSLLRNHMDNRLVQATDKALAASDAKTDFLANMSHEIRTPINAITGMINIARRAESKEENERCLDKIDIASKQLLALINDILDMSKIEAGKIELAEDPFELPSLLYNVRSIIGVQANEKNHKLNAEFSDDLPEIIIGDEMRISQLLINLLSNAVKFTPENGEITFKACRIKGSSDGWEELEFTVNDTGIGISEKQQQRLFSKFEQIDRGISRKYGGTGLGLAISQSLVELMNGEITVDSTLGKGSTFTARIKVKRGNGKTLNKKERAITSNQLDFSDHYALLAEDIEINQEVAIALLSTSGIQIDVAENGREVVDLYINSPDKYSIIFMDIHMPHMDGYAATKEIRSSGHPNSSSIPIIAMTANAFDDDIKKCKAVGMNDHIAKPIDADELFEKANKYMKK